MGLIIEVVEWNWGKYCRKACYSPCCFLLFSIRDGQGLEVNNLHPPCPPWCKKHSSHMDKCRITSHFTCFDSMESIPFSSSPWRTCWVAKGLWNRRPIVSQSHLEPWARSRRSGDDPWEKIITRSDLGELLKHVEISLSWPPKNGCSIFNSCTLKGWFFGMSTKFVHCVRTTSACSHSCWHLVYQSNYPEKLLCSSSLMARRRYEWLATI